MLENMVHENGIIPTKKLFQEKYKEYLEKIGKPIVVDVKPLKGCEHLNCFNNVANIVNKQGGEIIFGHICWVSEKEDYFHFEPHCIYKSPTGEIFDPTPQEDLEEQLLFLVDETIKVWDKKKPCSIYVPIRDNQLVNEFCFHANEYHKYLKQVAIHQESDNTFIWENDKKHLKMITNFVIAFGKYCGIDFIKG